MNQNRKMERDNLTQHERRVLELVRRSPEIVASRSARAKLAKDIGMSEKTLRNRLADLKRYGLIGSDGSIRNREISRISQQRGRVVLSDERPFEYLDYVRLLIKWRKPIVVNFIGISLLAAVLSLLMGKTYESNAVIMPPHSEAGLGMMASLTNLPFAGVNLGVESPESMTFLAILKSRTVMERVALAFNLMDVYQVENLEDAIEQLRKRVYLEILEEGTIRITSSARTGWLPDRPEEAEARQLAADMTNYMIRCLDSINIALSTSSARSNRQFMEERLNQNKRDLAEAEERLKAFQQRTGVVDIATQATALLEAYGQFYRQKLEAYTELYTRQVESEIKLNVAKATLSNNSPAIRQLEAMIQEQKSQIGALSEELDNQFEDILKGVEKEVDKLERGSNNQSVLLSFYDLPSLAMENAALLREVEVQNTLFIFLTQQFEEARIKEAKDTPTVQVLDIAIPPIKRSKPRRTVVVMAAGLSALLVSVGFVFFWERSGRYIMVKKA